MDVDTENCPWISCISVCNPHIMQEEHKTANKLVVQDRVRRCVNMREIGNIYLREIGNIYLREIGNIYLRIIKFCIRRTLIY